MVTNKLTGLVSVFRNLGGGPSAPPVPYRAGTGLLLADGSGTVTSLEATAGVVAGPFTPGGPTDLLTINPGSNTLGLLAGLGAGRFANPVSIQTAEPAQVVRVADFNHDGIPDIAVLTADAVDVYLGNGKGGFSAGHLQRRPRAHRPDRRRRQPRRQARPARRQRLRRRPGPGGPGRRHVPAVARLRPNPWRWPWPT